MLPSAQSAAAVLLVLGAIGLGWVLMWRLVLSKIPVVRAICGLKQLPPKKEQ